jgi:hypothetical protein
VARVARETAEELELAPPTRKEQEQLGYWEPQPFTYADPKAGRAFIDPVYDPYTRSVRPWGDFYNPGQDVDDRHLLKRPDEEHPGDWYDETYVQEIDALMEEMPPPAFVRDPASVELKPIKDLKKYAPRGRKGLENILSIFEQATPEEIDYWRNWYGYAHMEAVKLSEAHSRPADLCAGVIAVLSPKELWETNIYLADRALAQDWENVGRG